MDAISFKYSWLNSEEFMPNLYKKKQYFKNFYNHFATARNTKGNFPSILSGVFPHLHKVNNKSHKFSDNLYGHIQQKMSLNGYTSYYLGTQAFSRTEPIYNKSKKKDILDFDQVNYLSPSMSDFYIPGLKYNEKIKNKINEIEKNQYFLFLHYTDGHAPFETPNIKSLNYFSNEMPNIRKFLIKNIINLNFLRRIKYKYLNKELSQLNKKYFDEYPDLKKDILNSWGPVLSPERYDGFYELLWSSKNFYYEYKKLLKKAYQYQDLSINKLLEYIYKYKKDNTIIILTSDHVNNDIIKPLLNNDGNLLDNESLHVPLSILSFDEKIIQNNLSNNDNFIYTSHVDFYNSINRIFDKDYVDNDYEVDLFNVSNKKRYLMAQSNNDRQIHNQFRIFNEDYSIDIYSKPSNDMPDIINKENIINNIDEKKYTKYFNYLKKYNNFYKNRIEYKS